MTRHRTFLVALLSVAAACAPSSSDPGSILDGKADDLDPTEVPSLAASYRLDVQTALEFCKGSAGECDEAAETAAIEALAHVQLEQDGAEVSGTIKLCFGMLTTPAGKRHATDAGAFSEGDPTASIEAFPFTGRFIGVDGVPTLALDPSALTVGFNLGDPVTEAIVTDKNDSRIDDVDSDGKPGLSLKTPVGRIFFGARVGIAKLRAQPTDEGILEGAADLDGEFAIYGDTIPLVDAKKKVKKALADYLFPSVTHAVTLTAADGDCATL